MPANRMLMKESPAAAVVLSLLREHMDEENAIIISYESIMEMTGYSKSTVQKAVNILKKDVWIQAVKVGTGNAYRVNSEAYWTTNIDGKVYSKFKATVLASAKEQKKPLDKLKAVKLKNSDWIKGQ